MFPYRTENALSTDPENVIKLFEASSVCRDKIVDNYSGTWDERERRISKTLISTIPGQKVLQHLVSQKNNF